MPATKLKLETPSAPPLSFIQHLERNLASDPPKQRGARTRERLKIAAAKALEAKGYHALRVADVTAGAQVAEGSFYVYFKDKTDIALAVLTELLEEFFKLDAKATAERSPFEAIRQTNRRWLAVCRANAGLMRCILQLGDEEPELARLSRRTNRIWYERVARSLKRRKSNVGATGPALFALYLVGGMMDELVRKLVIYPDPEFHALLKEMGAGDEAIADAASILWLHIFHPDETAPADLPAAAATLAKWLAPAH